MSSSDPWLAIPKAEFVQRQDRARQAAREAGLDGLVVYSRGGGQIDMAADVLYLTNHYSQQPYVADHVGAGTARSHGVVILPVDGPSIVITDVTWWRTDAVVAGDVRLAFDVSAGVGQALKDSKLLGKRVGLVGTSNMSAAAYLGLVNHAGKTRISVHDDLIEKLRLVKSQAEIALLRQAAEIGSRAVEAMFDAAVPGATEAECVQAAYDVLTPAGGLLYDAIVASGPNAHHVVWGRLPSWEAHRRLQAGDIFHVDCYGAYGGYFWDFARTRFVGDNPSPQLDALYDGVIEVIEGICSQIRPGLTGHDVARIGGEWMANSSAIQSLPDAGPVGFAAVGHGYGLGWEAPWLMEGDQTVIQPGMALAIETFQGHPSIGGVFFEHNGLVTNSGFEIITTTRKRWHK